MTYVPGDKARRWNPEWEATEKHNQRNRGMQRWRWPPKEEDRKGKGRNTNPGPCRNQRPQRESWAGAEIFPELSWDGMSRLRSPSWSLWMPVSMLPPPLSSIFSTLPHPFPFDLQSNYIIQSLSLSIYLYLKITNGMEMRTLKTETQKKYNKVGGGERERFNYWDVGVVVVIIAAEKETMPNIASY